MAAIEEVRDGLEGVLAFASEIAEPDRDGGALRYRGVDIEELVGTLPFEVSRIAGIVAHALEDYEHRLRFRPRASYVGPMPPPSP